MASLREIKDRIGSVKSTLKITSAMKLVASSKLRKAQKAVENMRPYEEELSKILTALVQSSDGGSTPVTPPGGLSAADHRGGCGFVEASGPSKDCKEIAVVAISSNSSLCGGFNANVIKKTLETVGDLESKGIKVTVYSLGRKMAEAMKKAGHPSADYSQFISRPSYDEALKIADEILDDNKEVLLVYNHFVTTAKQTVVVEPWRTEEKYNTDAEEEREEEYIVEPGKEEVLEKLGPQVMMLKFYAAVLDSVAAEHAARTIAMQTASDNAQDLLAELTLEYNKGRQQKITAEILDLVGGISE